MSFNDHSFDWQGFKFFARLALIVMVGAVGVHFALASATENISQPEPSALVVVHQPMIPAAVVLSSSTPQRVINKLTIADAVPAEGKFIAADLVNMRLYLYIDGTTTAEFPILTKGRPGTPWETPSGFYNIYTKEETHFSSLGHVYMPYSMQFYGNYFIHGWPYYQDGTPVSSTFSGGCIRLATEDAKKVFEFADVDTKMFVYDTNLPDGKAGEQEPPPPLSLTPTPLPTVDAQAYLVADIDTGDVYAEQNAGEQRPIASLTKLMTALVANEIITLDKKVNVEEGELTNPQNIASTSEKTFLVNDLFYPLLMQSSNAIADSLASYYGKHGFVRWMNTTARALDMSSTTFADPSGVSADDISTTEDLFHLASYLTNKKSFVLKITRAASKTITADDGSTYSIHTASSTDDATLSVLQLTLGNQTRHIAVIVLGSTNQATDTQSLVAWITQATTPSGQPACAACTMPPQYRKIEQ